MFSIRPGIWPRCSVFARGQRPNDHIRHQGQMPGRILTPKYTLPCYMYYMYIIASVLVISLAESKHESIDINLIIFNNILSNGIYPTAWAEGYIVPIHKKNDKKDPNNYRGITISNSLGKLFNSILQNRLSLFVQQKNIINEEQIGFQKGCRTSDHMFILNSIIDLYRKK